MGQPANLPEAEETVILHQKVLSGQAFGETQVELGRKTLDKCNLTQQQLEGRKEILEGIRDKGWHLSKTDKSQRLVLGTKEVYLAQMRKHTTVDPVVSIEEVVAQEDHL